MGRQGIEPWTGRLKAECSTSELATREGGRATNAALAITQTETTKMTETRR